MIRLISAVACLCAAVTIGPVVFDGSCFAQDSHGDLAKKAQNPIANLISIPLQKNTSFNIGPYDRTGCCISRFRCSSRRGS
jgi:hypothetical protein